MHWTFLVIAILTEVASTLCLRIASTGRPRWFIAVAVGYVASFAAFSAGLANGLNLGVAYGIWAASGVVLTAIASRVLFHEPLSPRAWSGIALVAIGVLLVEIGATT